MPIDLDDIALREELLTIIAREGVVDRARLTEEATLDSLGLASIDVVMLLMAIEERFNVYLPIDGELSGVKSLPELLNFLADRVKSATPADAQSRAKAYGMDDAGNLPAPPSPGKDE